MTDSTRRTEGLEERPLAVLVGVQLPGVSDAEHTEIVEGLAPGDPIIVAPPETLRDGARVKARGTS